VAKLPTIRISKADRKEYTRLSRNTKSKIRRTKKNYGIDLESEIPVPDIDTFKTRKEFNEWKELQKSFTNRANTEYQFVKNEYDVVASKRELYHIERDTKQAQRIADKKIQEQKDRPVFHDGEQVGTVGDRSMYMKESDVTGIHRPKNFDFSKVRNRRRLEDIKESMSKRKEERYYDERNKIMLDNFIANLEGHFGSDSDELTNLLKTINPDDFYGLYQSNFYVFDFNLWDSEGNMITDDGDMDGQIIAMLDVVKKYKESDYGS